jgi:hypothetical protein
VCNIKHEAPALPASIKSEATEQAYKAMSVVSDIAQSQRVNNRKHATSSSIFSANTENQSSNNSRPSTATSKTASNIFGGGAFADDAAKSRPVSSAGARPALNLSGPALPAGCGGGGMASARATSQAALRGNGSLW